MEITAFDSHKRYILASIETRQGRAFRNEPCANCAGLGVDFGRDGVRLTVSAKNDVTDDSMR